MTIQPDPGPSTTDGMLAIRAEVRGGRRTIALAGELDLANAATAKRELRDALDADPSPLVIDMGELEFIDSTGIALLVSLLGEPADAGRISFLPSSSPAVQRVLELTGVLERLPLAEGGAATES